MKKGSDKTDYRQVHCHLLLSHFSRVRLCDPRDGSPPGSPVPGILQARALEWGAIAFSGKANQQKNNCPTVIEWNVRAVQSMPNMPQKPKQ